MARIVGSVTGSVYRTTLNGVTVYRAVKSVYVNGSRKQIKGTGKTEEIAISRLEENLRRWTGEDGGPLSRPNAERPGSISAALAESPLFGPWITKWVESLAHTNAIQDSTLVRYEATVRAHIVPHIGHLRLNEVTDDDLRRLLFETLPAKRKVRKGPGGVRFETAEPLLGNSPMRKIFDLLNGCFRDAVKQGKVAANPMDGIRRIKKAPPKEESLHKRTWIPTRLMEHLYDDPEAVYWVLSFYGLRQSERLGVETSSFTYMDNPKKPLELVLDRQLAREERTGRLYIKRNTKTSAGRRVIVLPDEVRQIFREHLRRRAEWEASEAWNPRPGLEDLVLVDSTGAPRRHQTDNRQWRAMLKRYGIEQLRHHAMRHVTATLLAKSGTHPDVAKSVLGHASSAMVTVYTHLAGADTAKPIAELSAHVLKDWRKKRDRSQAARKTA